MQVAAPIVVRAVTNNGWAEAGAILTGIAATATAILAVFTWKMAQATRVVAEETRKMATATAAMARATETTIEREIERWNTAEIAVTYERNGTDGPQAEWHLVLTNIGLGEALDVRLLTFNSRADGRNALSLLDADRKLLPVRRIAGGGGRVHIPVVRAFNDPAPPWQVTVQWTDARGPDPQIVEDITVTAAV